MLSIESVDGCEFAAQAAGILHQAWPPPALRYTPEYLRWQLSFPGAVQFPAVAAFEGSKPVGFAAITARRFRLGSIQWNSGILSFVAVLPIFRGKGIAGQLYQRLLSVIKDMAVPVLVFVQARSAGERTLIRAVSSSECQLRPAGQYQLYGYLPRPNITIDRDCYAVKAEETEAVRMLPRVVNHCATADLRTIWNDPSVAQIQHYIHDPRTRTLAVLKSHDEKPAGAAWIVQAEFEYSDYSQLITTMESVFIPWSRPECLVDVARLASAEFMVGAQPVVTASNLVGFDSARLRMAGMRALPSVPFRAYTCAASIPKWLCDAQCTNVEIV
jgi:GNAT superfamily N-acetyltransferase